MNFQSRYSHFVMAPLPAYSGSNFACLVHRTNARIAKIKASNIPMIARIKAHRMPHSPTKTIPTCTLYWPVSRATKVRCKMGANFLTILSIDFDSKEVAHCSRICCMNMSCNLDPNNLWRCYFPVRMTILWMQMESFELKVLGFVWHIKNKF